MGSSSRQSGVNGELARRMLKQLDSGEGISTELTDYPVQTWAFGNDLAMVFLAGEVVLDYSIRMSDMFDSDRLWVNAYCNDVPCYIPSKRILREGGYEAEGSLRYYGHPGRLSPEIEDTYAGPFRSSCLIVITPTNCLENIPDRNLRAMPWRHCRLDPIYESNSWPLNL
jgi:hypothetical protein